MLTVILTIGDDGLVSCETKKGDKTVHFEDLDRKEQIYVCNSFVSFYKLFSTCIKEEEL
jgi:hypothetical protein